MKLAFIAGVMWAGACCAQAPAPSGVPPAVTGAPALPAAQAQPAVRWTVDQAREAFQLADADADGRLTRAEAQRLRIMPRSFEDTDLNKDGAVTADEYLQSFQP